MRIGMIKFCTFLTVLIIAFLLSNCSIRFGSSPASVAIDPQKARALSDRFMEDFANDRRDAMYSKMEKEFHDITSREQFQGLMDTIYQRMGKLTHYEYDHEEIGEKT